MSTPAPSTTGRYVNDGRYQEPLQEGAVVPWQDCETRSTLWNVTYHQFATRWKRGVMGTKGPLGGFLVEESQPEQQVAGVVSWTQTFAEVPSPRTEAEEYVYGIQAILDGELVEIPAPTTSLVLHEYFHTTKPEKIKLDVAWRIVKVGAGFYFLGTPPNQNGANILAENALLTRWRGNIWVRRSRFVPPSVFKPQT